jgi:hypothetical protein
MFKINKYNYIENRLIWNYSIHQMIENVNYVTFYWNGFNEVKEINKISELSKLYLSL